MLGLPQVPGACAGGRTGKQVGAIMWIQKAKGTPLDVAAQRLQLTVKKGRSVSPCPACGAIYRGSEDKRGPVGMNGAGTAWQCHCCGKRGDVVDLVSYALFDKKLREMSADQKKKVRDWFENTGFIEQYQHVEPVIHKPKRPNVEQVASLWRASTPLNKMNGCREDQMVRDFLSFRKFDLELLAQTGMVKAIPLRNQYNWPEWWPGFWSPTWRLVTPAFEINGRVASLHARAVSNKAVKPKSRWPKGCEANGLLLANRQGVKLLRGSADSELEALLICEGITDLFRAASAAIHEKMNVAILAGTSGSFSRIKQISIPDSLDIVICTDPDETGDAYAENIKKNLDGKKVYRMKLEK